MRLTTLAVRALLACYPARFRTRFERDILASLARDLDEASSRGRGARAAVAWRELRETAAGIIPQHRLERARHGHPRAGAVVMHHLRSVLSDFTGAFRALRQTPLFTGIAVGVLAVGIGASTAIFSVVDATVLQPLPFPDPETIAVVLEYHPERAPEGQSTTLQTFLDWRNEQRSFSAIAASATTRFTMRNEAGEPSVAWGRRVTHGFFELLGAAPIRGRVFPPDEERDGAPRVAVISHAFWMRQFGGAETAIGRRIALDIAPDAPAWEIVGVLPRGFSYPVASPQSSDIYVPARIRPADTRRAGGKNFAWVTLGRLRPGVSMEQAQSEMSALMASIDARHPAWSPGARVRVMSLHHRVTGGAREWMMLLLGAVALVLLIACANVANLMLARATVRAREMGIRAALGAGRWRLTRMLMIEGLVLAGAGAVAGLAVAAAAIQVLTASLPDNLPRAANIDIDLRVVVAACAAALATGLIFGLLPALQSSKPDVTRALRDGGRSATSGRGVRLRSLLVVGELALAVMLVIGAGLFTASFVQLMRIDPGFDYRNVVTLNVAPDFDTRAYAAAVQKGPDATRAFFAERERNTRAFSMQVIDALRAIPGVVGAGGVNGGAPLTGSYMRDGVTLPGRARLESEADSIDVREVSPGYLEVLRVPLRAGRMLTEDDFRSGAKVAVVNEAAAAKYWPGASPLGQQLTINPNDGMLTVVGVVGDIRHLGPEEPRRQEAYLPRSGAGTVIVRTAGDPAPLMPAIRRAIWQIKPNQYLGDPDDTLQRHFDRIVAARRFNMALLSLLGVLALVIAAAGVYGVMAYTVSQRRQEIGVRMALGARPADVLRMVMQNAGVLVGAGLLIGSAAAWALSATVKRFLFLVAPDDWRILVVAAAVLSVTAAVACLIPARRAARIDPLIALRDG